VKKKALEENLDYEKLLEEERKNKDRKSLKEWLEDQIEISTHKEEKILEVKMAEKTKEEMQKEEEKLVLTREEFGVLSARVLDTMDDIIGGKFDARIKTDDLEVEVVKSVSEAINSGFDTLAKEEQNLVLTREEFGVLSARVIDTTYDMLGGKFDARVKVDDLKADVVKSVAEEINSEGFDRLAKEELELTTVREELGVGIARILDTLTEVIGGNYKARIKTDDLTVDAVKLALGEVNADGFDRLVEEEEKLVLTREEFGVMAARIIDTLDYIKGGTFDSRVKVDDMQVEVVKSVSEAINSGFDDLAKEEEEIRRVKEGLEKGVSELSGVMAEIAAGKYEVRVDIDAIALSEIKKLGGDINDALNVVSKVLEERLADAQEKVDYLNEVPTPVMVIDKDYNIRFINKTGADFTGKKIEDCIGKKCYDQFQTDHCQTDECRLKQAMAKDGTFTAETVSHAGRKDTHINYTGAPIKDMNGNIVGALEYVADITQLKEKEKEITKTKEELSVYIDETVEKVGYIGEGDLTVKANVDIENPVLSHLGMNINKMAGGFADIVVGVRTSATAVTDSSNTLLTQSEQAAQMSQQIAKTIQEMAKSSQEQSKQTEEIKGIVTEMSSSLQQVSSNVQHTAELSADVNKIAQEGGLAAEKGVSHLNEIREVVGKSAESINTLGDKSREISKIVGVITKISEQTNLLALNAAIEAARAGEAGRGFAVVADEVRKLAESSSEAADKISDLIAEVQDATGGAVKSMEIGTEKVEEGTKVVDSALGSLKEIAGSVQEVATQVQEISAAVQQQSSGVQQTVNLVTNIAASAEQNASSAEEISASTQEEMSSINEVNTVAVELNKVAKDLEGKVEQFKLTEKEKTKTEKESEEKVKSSKKSKIKKA